MNFSSEILKEISLEKSSSLNDSNLPGLMQKKKDEIFLKGNHDFSYGNKYRDENFKVGKVKLLNTNQYFDDYLIVKNKETNKLGMINYHKDSIILFPKYDDIRIIKRIYDYFVIAQKKNKLELLFDDNRVSENLYDEIFYDETLDIMVLKKDNLYGFVLFKNKNTFYPEVAYTDENRFVVLEPKYVNYKNSKYSSGYYSTNVLNVTDTQNKNYFISNLGYEYLK